MSLAVTRRASSKNTTSGGSNQSVAEGCRPSKSFMIASHRETCPCNRSGTLQPQVLGPQTRTPPCYHCEHSPLSAAGRGTREGSSRLAPAPRLDPLPGSTPSGREGRDRTFRAHKTTKTPAVCFRSDVLHSLSALPSPCQQGVHNERGEPPQQLVFLEGATGWSDGHGTGTHRMGAYRLISFTSLNRAIPGA